MLCMENGVATRISEGWALQSLLTPCLLQPVYCETSREYWPCISVTSTAPCTSPNMNNRKALTSSGAEFQN
ncbi:hypothetical protein Y1Q_0008503 [Alligator mississippiensis]|uniref:Uncharacterized protein n=1 Tax=Alligator mississippiensis TaxID=8496 RepID=A0A151M1L9_ALLMI|nr:hypothetical protein Y1Q_0008503 [Alligator mississippiensis]